MKKALVHRRHRYAFRGLITKLCRRIGVPEEQLDYFHHIEASYYNVTNIKGPDKSAGHMLATAEWNHKEELIMRWMFGLEMLHHRK